MPSFYFLIGDHWFEVRADDYIVQVSTNGMCSFCLTGSDNIDDDYWILGVAFMRHYYNIHDHTNKRFGFASYRGSPKTNPTPVGEIPTALIENSVNDSDLEELSERSNTLYYILAGAGVIIGLVIAIYFCCKKNKKKEDNSNN